MPKQIVVTEPHALGAAEVRRRLDKHTDWARSRLERDNIAVSISAWEDDARSFAATAMGQSVSGSLGVAEDSLRFTASLPWTLGIFSPAIELAARRYAADLLA